eukprot:scaffold1637_cov253-Pinguiococcus_pyrenoidosus.AAC.1
MFLLRVFPLFRQSSSMDSDASFGFRLRAKAEACLPSLAAFEHQKRLLQWGLKDGLQVLQFQFVRGFRKARADDFLQELLALPELQKELGSCAAGVEHVSFREKPCSVTNLDFFDRIRENDEVLAPSGAIRRCLDEEVNGRFVNDELSKLMLSDDGDDNDSYEPDEKDEAIYALLRILVGGGGMNQTSDSFDDYLDTLKHLYRDLIGVAKDRDTDEIKVTSLAFDVTDVKGGFELFPDKAQREHSAFLVFVEPLQWWEGSKEKKQQKKKQKKKLPGGVDARQSRVCWPAHSP